jgi:hypothetical protein
MPTHSGGRLNVTAMGAPRMVSAPLIGEISHGPPLALVSNRPASAGYCTRSRVGRAQLSAERFTSTEVVYGVADPGVTVLPEYGVSP